ncbi:MAG: F0F1 ATP synthase subunit B [Butyrivibrio sp.]|nr:F0F1 ATP synthase subunit B [Butyrivibrio sp.]
MLDISIFNIVCTIINLLILLFVVKKFLYGRIDAILTQRQEEIETATEAADKAIKEAQNTKREYEEKITLAEEEKEQILSDIKKQGYEEYDKIILSAKQKSEQIVTEARHNAEVEERRAKEALAMELTDVVVDAASKIAATKHSTADDIELYNKFINEAGAKDEQED